MVSKSSRFRNQRIMGLIVAAAVTALVVPIQESTAGGGGGRSGISGDCIDDTCNVEMTGLTFTPDSLKVRPGATVVWTNLDKVVHTVTGGGSESDGAKHTFGASSLLTSGEEWQRKFDTAGTFEYYCAVHPRMTAQVIVAGDPVQASSEFAPMVIAGVGISGALGLAAVLYQKRKRR